MEPLAARGKGPRTVHSSTLEREASGLQQELQAQTKGRQVRGIPCKKPPIARMESRVKVWVQRHKAKREAYRRANCCRRRAKGGSWAKTARREAGEV